MATEIIDPKNYTLKEIETTVKNLRMTYPDKSPVVVFSNGEPKLVWEGER